MRHALRFAITALLLCLIVIACKKDGTAPKPTTPTNPTDPNDTTITTFPNCTNEDATLCRVTKIGISDSTVVYDAQGRVSRYAGWLFKYSSNKIQVYRNNGVYNEIRLNSGGKFAGIWVGGYDTSNYSLTTALNQTPDSFDADGNLVRRLAVTGGSGLLFEETYTMADGSVKALVPMYEIFEYDNQGNVTKSYIFYYNSNTLTDFGNLLHIEYLEYDTKINPACNSSMRLLRLLQMGNFMGGQNLSVNNPTKIRYHFKQTDWRKFKEFIDEGTVESYYNESCFIKYSKVDTGGTRPVELVNYQYTCP